MEEHRLKPMPSNYDQELFLDIYKKTAALRSKLAYNIDERRFGVEKMDIESWFSSKFIFIFNRYYEEVGSEELKARIIKGLMLFKQRVLRNAYTVKAEAQTTMVDVTELYDNPTYSNTDEVGDRELRMQQIKNYMKSKLSRQAYDVFLTQTYPPDYIIEKLKATPKKIHRVPKDVLAEYFDMPIKKLEKYLKDIRHCTRMARMDLTPIY